MRTATVVLTAAAALAAAFSLFALFAHGPEAPDVAAPSQHGEDRWARSTPRDPETARDSEDEARAEPDTPDAQPAERAAPRFDVVRVEPDGSAVAAGSANPHAEIAIRVDGEAVGTAQADAAGDFVAFFEIAQAEGGATAARRLDLESRDAAGGVTESREPVIVAAPAADEPDAEPLVVVARETGIDVLQRPAPPAREGAGVTLDSSVQQADGVIALSGRAGGLKPVRIYANAQLVAETVADADGRWTATATAEDAAGADSLRIDEIAEDGSVSRRVETPFEVPADQPLLEPGEIVVSRGDTLWRIAENMLGGGSRYIVIYEANAERIRDPNLIFPGQVLSVPGVVSR